MTDMSRSPSSNSVGGERRASSSASKGASSVLHKIKLALQKKPEDADAEFEAARANFTACKVSLEDLVKDVQVYVDASKAFVEAGAKVSSDFAAYFGSLYDARDVPKNDRSLMIMASQSDMIHQKIAEDHAKVVAIMESRFFQKVQKPLEQLRAVSADVVRRDTLRKENMYYVEKVSKLQDKASHGKEAKKDGERRERNEKHLERTSAEFAESDAQTLASLKSVFDGRFQTAGPFLTGFLEAERSLVSSLHESVVAVDSSYKQAMIAQKDQSSMLAKSKPPPPDSGRAEAARNPEASSKAPSTAVTAAPATAAVNNNNNAPPPPPVTTTTITVSPPSSSSSSSSSVSSVSSTSSTSSAASSRAPAPLSVTSSSSAATTKNPFLADSPISQSSREGSSNPFSDVDDDDLRKLPVRPATSNPFDDWEEETTQQQQAPAPAAAAAPSASKNPFGD